MICVYLCSSVSNLKIFGCGEAALRTGRPLTRTEKKGPVKGVNLTPYQYLGRRISSLVITSSTTGVPVLVFSAARRTAGMISLG
jgi:hypothetical protein